MRWTKFFEKLQKNSAKKKIQRQFLYILLFLSVAYFCYGYWKFNFTTSRFLIGLVIVFALGILCFILPKLLKPLLFIWLLLGMLLGEITSFILLGIIYYLLFFPITFIIRKTSKNPPDTPNWHSREKDVIDYKKLS